MTGHVQGVGFRPFVYRLAQRHNVDGRVCNRFGDVEIVVQGESAAVAAFMSDLIAEAPPLAAPRISFDESCVVDGTLQGFVIAQSEFSAIPRIFLPADQFACDD